MEPLAKRQAQEATYRNFINGRWVTSSSTLSVRNLNPADTRDVLGVVPLSTGQDAEAAVQAAEAALEGWRETPAPQQGQIVARAAQVLAGRKEEVARALTREEGSP